MKNFIIHSFASKASSLLKIVIYTEAHANSSIWGYEPQIPESLSKFKKDLVQKKNDVHYF